MKYLLSLLILIFAFSIQTFAVDFTVNLTTDQHDADTGDGVCDINSATPESECTLRAAVEQANNLSSFARVLFNLPDNSTITLTTANGGEISLNSGGTLQIIGTGANNLTINGGAGDNRIFYKDNGTVTISGVTLTGGNGTGIYLSGWGGAIFARGGSLTEGSLTLDRVHVTGNTASSISFGGGVVFAGGTHRIINSTFSSNTAVNCGGFRNHESTLTVVNSTISGNNTAGSVDGNDAGGGFCNYGHTTLRNVTITNNFAGSGGGIDQSGQSEGTALNFGNTIVAGNNSTMNNGHEIRFITGSIFSAGGNPVERLFEELRRRLKFRVFDSLDEAENYVTEVLQEFLTDTEQVKSLTLYPYIKYAQSVLN